jgi:hypothetical protein
MCCGLVEGAGLEFNPQYHKKKKKSYGSIRSPE